MANTENLKKYGKILWDTLGKKASCNIIKSQVSNYINNICLKYGITEANASNLSKETTLLVDYLLDRKMSNLSIDMSFVQSIIIDRIVPSVIEAADDLEEGHKFIDEIIKAIELVGTENIDDILGGNESQWVKCIRIAKDKLLSRKAANPSIIECEDKPDDIAYIQDNTDQIYQSYGLSTNQKDLQFVDSISKRFDNLSFKTPADIANAIDVYVNSAADVAKFVEDSVEETLSYMDFPYEHWVKIRTNNGLERIMKEIRRRTRVVGSFPDGYSAMMLVGARLRHISTTKWGTRQYLCTCKIYEQGVI